MTSGYLSSASFYIFLIITIILIFILCISNIVAYGNILANDNIEFNHTWAKILIAMNAILIAIAFVIMIILIIKFYKGRARVTGGGAVGAAAAAAAAAAGAPPAAAAAAGAAAAAAAAGAPPAATPIGPDIHNTGMTISELKGLMTGAIDPNDYPNQCSDGSSELYCPYASRNDRKINKLYNQYTTEGNPVNPFAGAFR